MIFKSNNLEVLAFSRKIERRRKELPEELIIEDENKRMIALLEILGDGRQFMTPLDSPGDGRITQMNHTLVSGEYLGD